MPLKEYKMRVLNLYAGIGGNRKLWKDVEVVAIEHNPQIAAIYADLFPQDTLIIGDAHAYSQNHYMEFDFIWSSPPCQTHSNMRQNLRVRFQGVKPMYPDMSLYQQIIFLTANAQCKWVVENVKPYYKPLIEPTSKLQRHLYWANFDIPHQDFPTETLRDAQIPELQELYGYDLSKYKISNKRQVLRNCVHPLVGEYILGVA